MDNKPCKNCGSYGGNVGCDVCGPPIRRRNEEERLTRTACSAWRDPETDPPTKTGKILIWVEGIGPSIVNVEERWMCYWNGNDETEPTAPHEWDWWMEISPPNARAMTPGDTEKLMP